MGGLSSIFKFLAILAVPIVKRIADKDAAIANFYKAAQDAIKDDGTVGLSDQIDASGSALDEELKKRGL